ncbi:hypothetical protein U0035_09150 [Niabella yanshanensis]|uniref:CCDC81-like prokaryotic HU domain-containing protein n=1 Tax=Niabella yanshanensis TaxID=577386 RepID=A0ABZ0WC26_9BACT|nr:hypothetical protein [Niabella yanshanensis]WQD40309.1 hypothetical protein U0035_09150 [Niabella yanshanensis]
MFDILLQYLFEFKRLSLPTIGGFELENKVANANLADSTIAAPTWIVGFRPYSPDVNMDEKSRLVSWLAGNRNISMDEAGRHLEQFITDLQSRLSNGETVNWPGLGILEQRDGQVVFQPTAAQISPFTDVTAKKISRENTSHQTLVGDKETTTAEMREQLLLPDEKRRSGTTLMWVVLGIALIAAAWFFSQKGCNTSASGNQQKVESSQPGETYKLR